MFGSCSPYRIVSAGETVSIEAASEIHKRIPEYRYKVVGDIRTMHNVGMCRWGSGRVDEGRRCWMRIFWAADVYGAT
jgi:hypothetical protein